MGKQTYFSWVNGVISSENGYNINVGNCVILPLDVRHKHCWCAHMSSCLIINLNIYRIFSNCESFSHSACLLSFTGPISRKSQTQFALFSCCCYKNTRTMFALGEIICQLKRPARSLLPCVIQFSNFTE